MSQFGAGLNTQDTPAELDPSAAQDLLNVNIQPGGASIFKRDGYGLFQTLPQFSTAAVHGGYHFQQTGGSDVQLWGSDINLYASVSDATFVKIATGTDAATWQCADSQGSAYCLSSSRDMAVKTDGTTANTSYQNGVPLGTMLTFTPTQLVVAGVSGNESTLYISQQNAFTTFTVGVLPSSAFTEPIASPGSRITHVAYYFGKLFWWKDQSFGYATFTNQNDWQLTIVSNQVGTLDNSDAFWNSSGFDSGAKFSGTASANAEKSPGGIFFRGQDNHLYVYDGYYLTRLSRVISPTVTTASRRKSNSWTQSSASDWNSGSLTPSGYFTSASSLLSFNSAYTATLSTSTTFNSSDWTAVSGITFVVGVASVAAAPGQASMTYNNSLSSTTVYSAFQSTISVQLAHESFSNVTLNFRLTDASGNGYAIQELQNGNEAGPFSIYLYPLSSNSLGTQFCSSSGPTYDTNFHTLSVRLSSGTGTISALFDGTVICSSVTSTSYSLKYSTITFAGDGVHTVRANISSFSFSGLNALLPNPSTGTFLSAVDNAPSLTSWGTLSIADSLVGNSTITYYSRSSTSSFTVSSSTPAWVLQQKNATVSASTGTYFQLRADFSITAATETPALNDFIFNWFEGTAASQSFMTYFNDAIWFSVSASSSVSTNNRIFYWDILNGAWLIYDIPSNGFLIENNSLYFGSPTAGKVYQFGSVTTDNGAAINSYWRSKSFLGADPFVQNEFVQADFVLGESSTTLTYTYTLDSKTATAYSMTAYDSAASLIQRNFLLPVGKIGKYYDFKIGDNSSNTAWRLMGHRVHYNALNWKPVTN